MSTSETERARLAEEIRQLQRALNAFGTEPVEQALSNEIKKLQQELNGLMASFRKKEQKLKSRIHLPTLEKFLHRCERYQKLCELHAPQEIILNEQRLIEQARTPAITGWQELYRTWQQTRVAYKEQLDERKEKLRVRKQELETALKEARAKYGEYSHTHQMQSDSDTQRSSAALSASCPQPTVVQSRRRKRQLDQQTPVTQPQPRESAVSWQFMYWSSVSHKQWPLPIVPTKMLGLLRRLMISDQLALRPRAVLKKLHVICSLPVHERNTFKLVIHDRVMEGWRIARIGDYRLLFIVDEAARMIRFTVRNRGVAYPSGHFPK